VQAAELFSQWLGESEEGVRRLFRTAQHAAPCIIFFDQLDAIATRRSPSISNSAQRVLNQLLAELDGLQERTGVVVIGATNELSLVDPAALRPGRFGVHLYVGLPNADERAEIVRIHLREFALDESLVDHLVRMTEGFSGAELAGVCQLAKLRARTDAGGQLAREDFNAAVEEISDSSVANRGPGRAGGDQPPDTSPD
jgi:transitional endoplasmic reticulum ATPase